MNEEDSHVLGVYRPSSPADDAAAGGGRPAGRLAPGGARSAVAGRALVEQPVDDGARVLATRARVSRAGAACGSVRWLRPRRCRRFASRRRCAAPRGVRAEPRARSARCGPTPAARMECGRRRRQLLAQALARRGLRSRARQRARAAERSSLAAASTGAGAAGAVAAEVGALRVVEVARPWANHMTIAASAATAPQAASCFARRPLCGLAAVRRYGSFRCPSGLSSSQSSLHTTDIPGGGAAPPAARATRAAPRSA